MSRTADILELLAVAGVQTTNDISESLGLSEPEDLRALSALLYNLAQRELVSNEGGEGAARRWKITKEGRARVDAPIQIAAPAAAGKVDQVLHRPTRARLKKAQSAAPAVRVNGSAPLIERGIPIPARVFRSRYDGLFAEMQISDSVVLTDQSQATHVARLMRKHGMKAAQRKAENGSVRVWRIG